MATGLPIVTVKKGALKETIVDNKNGFFIDDKNNIEMLSEKLKILINNRELRYNTGQYSRQLVEENFSENIQLEKYYRFYKKILNERNN